MPGYAKRAKGKKNRHHHGTSPVRRREVPIAVQTMEQDPFCAYMLRAAQDAEDAETAEHFRQTAVRVWRERKNPASVDLPPRATGTCESEEDSALLPVFPEEEETGEPILVGTGALSLTPPEDEFGETDSPGEEEDETYPPSECSEATLDYDKAEGDDEAYPPSVCSESTLDYGEGDEDTSSLPSSHTFSAERHEVEVDVSPPPSVFSAPTVYYGEGEDASRSPSVCSSPFGSEDESEGVESVSGRSGSTVHLKKEVPRSSSAASSMAWSRCPTPEESMSLGRSVSESEEEMETSGGEAKASPREQGGPGVASAPRWVRHVPLEPPWTPAGGRRKARTPAAPRGRTKAPRGKPPAARPAGAPSGTTRARSRNPRTGEAPQPVPPAASKPPGGTPLPVPPASPAQPAFPGGIAPPCALWQAAGAMPWLPVPICLSIPLCLPNFLFPFVPLVFHVPVCVFVSVPLFNVFSPVFPGRVC
ncbi:uncharacterized protein LOC143485017 isoform X2 [Brachyhypopomus gauderio]